MNKKHSPGSPCCCCQLENAVTGNSVEIDLPDTVPTYIVGLTATSFSSANNCTATWGPTGLIVAGTDSITFRLRVIDGNAFGFIVRCQGFTGVFAGTYYAGTTASSVAANCSVGGASLSTCVSHPFSLDAFGAGEPITLGCGIGGATVRLLV